MARCGYSYHHVDLGPGRYELVPSFRPTRPQASSEQQELSGYYDDYVWPVPCPHLAADVTLATPACVYHVALRQRPLAIVE